MWPEHKDNGINAPVPASTYRWGIWNALHSINIRASHQSCFDLAVSSEWNRHRALFLLRGMASSTASRRPGAPCSHKRWYRMRAPSVGPVPCTRFALMHNESTLSSSIGEELWCIWLWFTLWLWLWLWLCA